MPAFPYPCIITVFLVRILFPLYSMIIFLHGEDSFLVSRRKQALMKAFEKKYSDAEFFVFDFEDQSSLEDIKRAFGSAEGGLFSSAKMVVFLHPMSLPDAGENMCIEFLKQQKQSDDKKTILLFVQNGKIKKTNSVIKVLQKVADTEEMYSAHSPKEEITFAKKELKEIAPDVEFSPRALSLFLLLTAGNSARRISEIEKLASYKGSGIIEEDDVRLLVESPEENVIFSALDALGRGDTRQALVLFHREAKKSEGAFPILSMCAWQVRRILLVREAYDRGIRRAGDIASVAKLPPFVVQKMLGSIQNFPLERAKKGLSLLSELDSDLKRGRKDPAVALDLFIWKF